MDKHRWYHGSPLQLTELLTGSTITEERNLAEVFSHKPAIVSRSAAGEIKHNGVKQGYLYLITDEVQPEDIYPHPETAMPEGLEWLTRRLLKVRLLGVVELRKEECLTEEDLQRLVEWRHTGD